MNKSYPVSKVYREVLNYIPHQESCISNRDLNTLLNQSGNIVFLWLKNGNGFWYQIISIEDEMLTGYIIKNNYWKLNRLSLTQISSYY